MLPTTSCDRTNCLTSLIGIQSDPCLDPTKCPPFFVEQIDGVDIDKLSQIAGPSDLSGKAYAQRMIQSAAMEMLGDMDLLVNNGYSLLQNVGETCSDCQFTSIYVPGGGIKIQNSSLSTYSQLRISSLRLKANATGDHVLKIDDGETVKTWPIQIEAGVIMPFTLDYVTQKKSAYISLVDQTVGLAQVSCPVKSTCGCGLRSATNLITYSGMIGGLEAATQYGFIGCANISCSNDILICEMIRQTPNLFGLTLLYKVGEKINNGSKLTLRNNRVSTQPDEIKNAEVIRYASLYKKRITGTSNEMGLKQVISDYLSRKGGDSCIQCNTLTRTSFAIG